MKFDKWFNNQSRLIQILLLLIPIVNWVVEVLVRLSAVLRKASVVNIVGIVLAIVCPFWGWVDLIWILLFNKLCLTD